MTRVSFGSGLGFVMEKYELVIKADTNDGDYVTSTTAVSEETIEKLKPIVEAIKAKGRRHNWPRHEYGDSNVETLYPELTRDQIELFDDLRPYGEHGIHTIESVVYYLIPDKTILL
jgi:hypothetical protein